ncbi:hypothetical protein INT47_012742 [Mucor saturninus]|uniref:Uncharacterized protein n=1 Tax=Mucor saturninus TaxID=64648 RepID=A0A8H7R3J2_9FUNG|nr:hypothetical protein INT47_012742 [Mucor saturninus]
MSNQSESISSPQNNSVVSRGSTPTGSQAPQEGSASNGSGSLESNSAPVLGEEDIEMTDVESQVNSTTVEPEVVSVSRNTDRSPAPSVINGSSNATLLEKLKDQRTRLLARAEVLFEAVDNGTTERF